MTQIKALENVLQAERRTQQRQELLRRLWKLKTHDLVEVAVTGECRSSDIAQDDRLARSDRKPTVAQ